MLNVVDLQLLREYPHTLAPSPPSPYGRGTHTLPHSFLRDSQVCPLPAVGPLGPPPGGKAFGQGVIFIVPHPTVARVLGFSGLIRRSAPFSHLLRHKIYSNPHPHEVHLINVCPRSGYFVGRVSCHFTMLTKIWQSLPEGAAHELTFTSIMI
jgi:hypothetical protein